MYYPTYDCECVLKITGPDKDVSPFVAKAKDVYRYDEDNAYLTEFSFARFLPVPTELAENYPHCDDRMKAALKEKYGFEKMSDWCEEHWGVPFDVIAEYNGDIFTFSTERDPSVNGIVEISKQYPESAFHFKYRDFCYGDETMADLGVFVIKLGAVVAEKREEKAKCALCSRCDNEFSLEDCRTPESAGAQVK